MGYTATEQKIKDFFGDAEFLDFIVMARVEKNLVAVALKQLALGATYTPSDRSLPAM